MGEREAGPLPPRGLALRGRLWPGGATPAYDDGLLVVDGAGTVVALGPADHQSVPADVRILGGPGYWVGPGVVDAHVHLAFGSPDAALLGGVVALRDLGAPPDLALAARGRRGPPVVATSGPILTAPGGYPGRSWGADGTAHGVSGPVDARAVVHDLAADGVDLIKVALESAGGLPVLDRATLAALVVAAHEHGLAVTAHALTVAMVARALDAGVDELCHTPVEVLPSSLLDRLVTSGTCVVSTLQTLVAQGDGVGPACNAAALHAAGVPLLYGTDLGNAGTAPGVDPRELDRLAAAGLGRLGALRAATEGAAVAVGLRGRAGNGRLEVGRPARAVLLPDDPLTAPEAWRAPTAVLAEGRLLNSAGAGPARST